MSTLSERLRKARQDRNFSLESVGRACGVSPQAVHGWEVGKYNPSAAALSTIAVLTHVDLRWLITGEGEARHDKSTSGRHVSGRIVPSIPFTEIATRTSNGSLVDGDLTLYARSHFQCGPKSFQTTIIDRSNEPILVVGDSIIVDPDVAPMPGDFLVLTMKNRDVLIRRYRPREKRIELVPANADWPTVTIKSLSVVQLVGVVTEHCRRLR